MSKIEFTIHGTLSFETFKYDLNLFLQRNTLHIRTRQGVFEAIGMAGPIFKNFLAHCRLLGRLKALPQNWSTICSSETHAFVSNVRCFSNVFTTRVIKQIGKLYSFDSVFL